MTSPTQRRKEKAKKKGREAAFFCADRLYRKAFGLCGERGKGREKKVGGKFFFIRFQTLPRVMIFFYRLQKKKKTRKSSPPLTPPQLLFISALRMSFLPYCTRLPLLPGYELKVFLYLLILQHSNVIQLKPCGLTIHSWSTSYPPFWAVLIPLSQGQDRGGRTKNHQLS